MKRLMFSSLFAVTVFVGASPLFGVSTAHAATEQFSLKLSTQIREIQQLASALANADAPARAELLKEIPRVNEEANALYDEAIAARVKGEPADLVEQCLKALSLLAQRYS